MGEKDCDSTHKDSSQLRESRDAVPAQKSLATLNVLEASFLHSTY